MSYSFTNPPLTINQLEKNLTRFCSKTISIKINENRSTYLSVLENSRRSLRLSLHKLFLHSNNEIWQAVVAYCLSKNKKALQKLRLFSNQYFATSAEAPIKTTGKIYSTGKYFDLQTIYDELNQVYFSNQLSLRITWFVKPKYKKYRSITFGSYVNQMKLIRINDILDHPEVPYYFLQFVIYHEMLHDVCPPVIDKSGRMWIHTPLFKKREKEFIDFSKAVDWEKRHFTTKRIFRGWS